MYKYLQTKDKYTESTHITKKYTHNNQPEKDNNEIKGIINIITLAD